MERYVARNEANDEHACSTGLYIFTVFYYSKSPMATASYNEFSVSFWYYESFCFYFTEAACIYFAFFCLLGLSFRQTSFKLVYLSGEGA